jgi:hypothetical protein
MTNLIKVTALKDFQVPNMPEFLAGGEYFIQPQLAAELKNRGLLAFADTEVMTEKLDENAIVGKKEKKK